MPGQVVPPAPGERNFLHHSNPVTASHRPGGESGHALIDIGLDAGVVPAPSPGW
jgi:hypothetical protein